jgi:hypothetical protein
MHLIQLMAVQLLTAKLLTNCWLMNKVGYV